MSTFRERITGTVLKAVLGWKSRPGAVEKTLSGRGFPPAPPPDGDRVRVGVVQLELCLTASAAEYADKMYTLTRQAVEGGAQLVVFPEHTGTPLLGLLPGIGRLAAGAGSLDEAAARAGASVPDVFRTVSPAARRICEATFSTLARRFGVHLVAGSILLPDEREALYNVACLYGPDGRLIGTQCKTHLFIVERQWGLATGDEIHVFDTPVGRLAFPVCMDHTFFEPERVAYLQAAEILIDPAANPEPYNRWEQLRGVWGRVQESPAYGVLSCMVGRLAGLTFGGRSGVYAPLEMTPDGSGIVAQAESADREEVLLADLDLSALRHFRREHAPDFNSALYKKYLPGVYRAYRERETQNGVQCQTERFFGKFS